MNKVCCILILVVLSLILISLISIALSLSKIYKLSRSIEKPINLLTRLSHLSDLRRNKKDKIDIGG